MTALERIRADVEQILGTAVHNVAPFGDGHSGFTYLVTVSTGDGTRTLVLRLSPPGARIAGPADIGRQGRIMRAMADAGLPVPPIIATDSEPIVDGRAFVLMGLVEGQTWAAARTASGDRAVTASAIDVLLRMHELPPERTGIASDRPYQPIEELESWVALLPRCPDFVREPAEKLGDDLRETAPAPGATSLVHGDYHYGNLIFDPSGSGSVIAVVDWEIARLGDPLSDLGCLAVASLRRKYSDEPNPTGDLDTTSDELICRYDADPARAGWFIAETCFKYAAILGYNYSLHRSGRRPDPTYDQLTETMRGLVDDGRRILCSL